MFWDIAGVILLVLVVGEGSMKPKKNPQKLIYRLYIQRLFN